MEKMESGYQETLQEWDKERRRKMPELTVVVPFVNEYPQIIFTLQSINQELSHRQEPVDFEVIAVNNYCEEVVKQDRDLSRRLAIGLAGRFDIKDSYKDVISYLETMEFGFGPEDKGGEVLRACMPGNKWLKVLEYREKLSHWNAKRIAVENSDSKFIWFCDAHCIVGRNSVYPMFQYYNQNYKFLNGTIHLPLTYKILEWRRLIYSLRYVRDEEKAQLDYKFTNYRDPEIPGIPYEVPCMSTCGMMITREIYEEVGGWPRQMGIYSGGEHFMNFTLAVIGKKKWIYPAETALYHHGDKRGYSFNSGDTLRNRLIAAYLYGGKEWLVENAQKAAGRRELKERFVDEILRECSEQRNHIKSKQKRTIFKWIKLWRPENGE